MEIYTVDKLTKEFGVRPKVIREWLKKGEYHGS